MPANARDVIARAIVDHESPKGVWNAYVASYPIYKERADAIIAALDQAGYAVVKKPSILEQYFNVVVDPTMPDDEIEIRSDVDSVRLSDLSISHQIRWALQKAKLEQENALLHPPKRDPADEPEVHYNYYLKDDYPSVL